MHNNVALHGIFHICETVMRWYAGVGGCAGANCSSLHPGAASALEISAQRDQEQVVEDRQVYPNYGQAGSRHRGPRLNFFSTISVGLGSYHFKLTYNCMCSCLGWLKAFLGMSERGVHQSRCLPSARAKHNTTTFFALRRGSLRAYDRNCPTLFSK